MSIMYLIAKITALRSSMMPFKDALISKTGIIKHYWEEKQKLAQKTILI